MAADAMADASTHQDAPEGRAKPARRAAAAPARKSKLRYLPALLIPLAIGGLVAY